MWSRALVGVAIWLGACDHAEPPARPTTTSTPEAAPRHERRLSRPRPRDGAAEAAAPGPSASGSDAQASAPDAGAGAAPDAAAAAPLAAPALLGDDGKPLAQTEGDPSESSPWFQTQMRALFRAIQADDPALAESFFFPLVAYEQVKDVKEPKRDWEKRLMAHYRRDIHDYHKRLGKDASLARFEGIELAKDRKKWMKPHTEGNRIGYFRVTRSRLRYTTSEGKPASLEVTSFISWRGEWYLVHLNGFD